MVTIEPTIEERPAVIQVPNKLFKELDEIIKHKVANPEVVHWYRFTPCAGVRYYAYHAEPSPVEPLVPTQTDDNCCCPRCPRGDSRLRRCIRT